MPSNQSPHPYLNFCPYLPLREPIEFADWSVGPLSAFAERWTDARFKAQAEAFLKKFVDHEGKPLEHPSLVVRRSGAVDGTRPSDVEIGALNLALTFAALEGNPRRTEDTRHNPWSMMTTDNAELHVWPVDVEDGDVTVTSGGIIRTISGGYKIADEQLIIRPPRELFMPMGTGGLKGDVLEAVYKVALDAPTGRGRAAQVRTTIEWLGKAWWNTERITWPERIVYIKTGFEALTGTSKSRESAQKLRALFEQLPGTSASDSDRLVWSPAETERHPHTWKGKTENQTDLEDWFMAFALARNEIIHDGVAASLKYQTPGTNYDGDFFSTGEFVLRAAIRAALHMLGYPDLWQSEIHRAVVAAMKAAEAQEGSGTAGA